MRLLVSVRSADEVGAAIRGGADIIDAKDPSRGSLGPVSTGTLAEILERVPPHRELSAALGDSSDPLALRTVITNLPVLPRPAPVYLKLGFAGISSHQQIRTMLDTACSAVHELPHGPRIIAVAYGDSEPAATATPESICRIAAEAGAAGVLLDTRSKSSGQLFDWMVPGRVRRLLAEARRVGLLTAVAGSLRIDQLEVVRWTEPDIVGFRGAVCIGGRMGRVSEIKVRALRERLGKPASAFVQELVLPR